MPTIEERLQALEQEHTQLEQEHTQLKKTIELQTTVIEALANKAPLEELSEKYNKLIAQGGFTNE